MTPEEIKALDAEGGPMSKPKSKLEKAKEKLVDQFGERHSEVYAFPDIDTYQKRDRVWFRRQLNNLIRLAKAEAKEERGK